MLKWVEILFILQYMFVNFRYNVKLISIKLKLNFNSFIVYSKPIYKERRDWKYDLCENNI
jgi:hypothetical protein